MEPTASDDEVVDAIRKAMGDDAPDMASLSTGLPGNALPTDLVSEVQATIGSLIQSANEELRDIGKGLLYCGQTGQSMARYMQGDIDHTNDTSPRAILQAAREVEIVRLRLTGLDLRSIARKLGMVNAKGEPKVSTVHKMLTKAMTRWFREDTDELRNMELARLDRITERIWPIIEREGAKGDDDRALRAIERYMAVSDRRAKLVGLDAPLKSQTVFKGEVVQETTVRIEMVEAVDEYLGLVDDILATEMQHASAIDVTSTLREGEIEETDPDDDFAE